MPVLHIAAMLANIKARYIHHVKAMADGEGTPVFFIGKPQSPSPGFQVVLSATPRGRRPRPPPNHGRRSPGGGDKGHCTTGQHRSGARPVAGTWAEYPWSSLHSHTTAEWALTRRDLSSDKLVCWRCWSWNIK